MPPTRQSLQLLCFNITRSVPLQCLAMKESAPFSPHTRTVITFSCPSAGVTSRGGMRRGGSGGSGGGGGGLALHATTQRIGQPPQEPPSLASLSSILREAMAHSPPPGYESGYAAPRHAPRWPLNVTAPSSAAVLLPGAVGLPLGPGVASRHPRCHPGPINTRDGRKGSTFPWLTYRRVYFVQVPAAPPL